MCLVIGDNLLYSATSMQLWLSSKTLQNNSGFGIWTSKINDNSFISVIKVITSRIAWINAVYSASVLFKEIYVCNFWHHNTGNPTYVITYLIRDTTFLHYRHLLDPIHRHIWHLQNIRYLFLYWFCKLTCTWLTIDYCLVNPHN